MIVATLTDSPSSYSSRQIVEVVHLRGHDMVVHCRSKFSQVVEFEPRSATAAQSNEEFEAIIAWLDVRDLGYGLSVMRECEAAGSHVPNTPAAIEQVCDRLWLAQLLVAASIPALRIVTARTTDDISTYPNVIGDGPWIGVADVALIRSDHGTFVLDVNPFPRLQWWDRHSSKLAANHLFELIEPRLAAPRITKGRN